MIETLQFKKIGTTEFHVRCQIVKEVPEGTPYDIMVHQPGSSEVKFYKTDGDSHDCASLEEAEKWLRNRIKAGDVDWACIEEYRWEADTFVEPDYGTIFDATPALIRTYQYNPDGELVDTQEGEG